jgi:uncharacterized lipoprotein YajG
MKLLGTIFFICINTLASAQDIWVSEVNNLTVSGPVVGNRDLSFGIKNILEEVLQDRDFDINPNSDTKLSVDIIYFDVKKSDMQLGAFSKKVDTTVIILTGYLTVDGVVTKTATVKGQSKAISTSTLIIDQGGRFSQANISIALKKVCDKLISDLKL